MESEYLLYCFGKLIQKDLHFFLRITGIVTEIDGKWILIHCLDKQVDQTSFYSIFRKLFS